MKISHTHLGIVCRFSGTVVLQMSCPSTTESLDNSSGNVSEGDCATDNQEDSFQGRQKTRDKSATPRKDGSKRSVLSKSVPGYKVEEKSPWLNTFTDQPLPEILVFQYYGTSACCTSLAALLLCAPSVCFLTFFLLLFHMGLSCILAIRWPLFLLTSLIPRQLH